MAQVIPTLPVEEEDERAKHHAQYVEMGGKERRDQLNIKFPEFSAKTKPVSSRAVPECILWCTTRAHHPAGLQCISCTITSAVYIQCPCTAQPWHRVCCITPDLHIPSSALSTVGLRSYTDAWPAASDSLLMLQAGGLNKQRSGMSASRQNSVTSRTMSDMHAMYGGGTTPATAMSSMSGVNPTPRYA